MGRPQGKPRARPQRRGLRADGERGPAVPGASTVASPAADGWDAGPRSAGAASASPLGPWCGRAPASVSRGASGLWGHRAGGWGSGAGWSRSPGGARTQRSCPARFSACDLRAPRGSRRPGWLEEETRKGGWGEGARRLGALPAGSPPPRARTRRPWPPHPARGRPRVGPARCKRAPRASSGSWRVCGGPGSGGARGREAMTRESSSSPARAWPPRRALETRQGSAQGAPSPPEADRPQARPRTSRTPPREPAVRGRWRRARPASRAVPPPARPPSGSSARPARPARALRAATGGAAGPTPRSSAPTARSRRSAGAHLQNPVPRRGRRGCPSARGPERGAGGGGSLTGPRGPSGAGRGRSVPSRRVSPRPALPAPLGPSGITGPGLRE